MLRVSFSWGTATAESIGIGGVGRKILYRAAAFGQRDPKAVGVASHKRSGLDAAGPRLHRLSGTVFRSSCPLSPSVSPSRGVLRPYLLISRDRRSLAAAREA